MLCVILRTPRIPPFATSIETVKKLGPGRAYLTHLSHDLPHQETEAMLPKGVHLAYDGLILNAG